MHNYHDAFQRLPPADGGVSWRVHLLPFIEQEGVYRQFKLDQSWDSPSNKRLASQRIVTYLAAGDPPEEVQTHYRVFVGPHTLYEPGEQPLNFGEVKDGIGSTIMVVEATETVPWPQPKELQYDRAGPLPPLGLPSRNGFNVAMMDGSVRFVSDKTSPDSIRGGIDPKDGRFFEP
jgi:prepilin-type processing-associated H-X9-DG protein